MTQDQRRLLERGNAMIDISDVGMTDATGSDLYPHFSWAGLGIRPFLNPEGLILSIKHCRLHGSPSLFRIYRVFVCRGHHQTSVVTTGWVLVRRSRFTVAASHLLRQTVSPIHAEKLPGDIASLIRGKENKRGGNIFRFRVTIEQNPPQIHLSQFWILL